FGTGYSSLSYLKSFPLNTLKIDRSFISKMDQLGSYEIVKTIVSLAHNLGLKLVAEGVESIEQEGQLQAIGCEFAQGYYYSRPVPHAEALKLIAKDPVCTSV
ncbi:MAG: EAL domain-containing protein, partial [Cyanobacteria bacterium P01_F01_bin.42]